MHSPSAPSLWHHQGLRATFTVSSTRLTSSSLTVKVWLVVGGQLIFFCCWCLLLKAGKKQFNKLIHYICAAALYCLHFLYTRGYNQHTGHHNVLCKHIPHISQSDPCPPHNPYQHVGLMLWLIGAEQQQSPQRHGEMAKTFWRTGVEGCGVYGITFSKSICFRYISRGDQYFFTWPYLKMDSL